MREIANLREQVFGLTPTVLVGLSFLCSKTMWRCAFYPSPKIGGRAAAAATTK